MRSSHGSETRHGGRWVIAVLALSVMFASCGAEPVEEHAAAARSDLRHTSLDEEHASVEAVIECCGVLFRESTQCEGLDVWRTRDFQMARRCESDRLRLFRSEAHCIEQGLLQKGICHSANDNVVPQVVQDACGPEAGVLDGSSCETINADSVLAVVTENETNDLIQRGFRIVRQPGLARDGFVTVEASLPMTSPLWAEIGSVETPSVFSSLKLDSADKLRPLHLALWLRQQPNVRHARPIYGYRSQSILTTITDTKYTASGDFLATAKAKLINLRDAWRVMQFASFGVSEVRLAVVDRGFKTEDSDLNDPIDLGAMNQPNDEPGKEWHGHWVASSAGAISNNRMFAAGSSPLADLGLDAMNPLPTLRVIRSFASSRDDNDLAAAVNAAIDAGADIVNMSFGRYCDSTCQFFGYDPLFDPMVSALNRARDSSIIVTASAGNDNKDLGPASTYYVPCELGRDLVLCVGASTDSGTRADFSNHDGAVDVYAPGENVLVTADLGDSVEDPNTHTMTVSGTSFSAPILAGILSGAKAMNPALRTLVAQDLVAASSSSPHDVPIVDAAALMRHVVNIAPDHYEGGDYIDPLPTTSENLTLVDEDLYSFTASICESVDIDIDYVALADGATAPYVSVLGNGRDPVPFVVADRTANRRSVSMGPLDAGTYTLVLGRRPTAADALQLPLGYTLNVKRASGTSCERAQVVASQIPSSAEAGRELFVTATFKNTGATVWRPETHRVMAVAGSADFAFAEGERVDFDVHPGESFTASIKLTAPSALGSYPFGLQMYRDGAGFFGERSSVVTITTLAPTGLDVRFDPPAGEVPPRVCLAPAIYRYTLVNQGTTSWAADFRLQLYRRASGAFSPWSTWLSAALGRDVPVGGSITVELLMETIDVPGSYEVRADLQHQGASIGAGSAFAQSNVGIFDYSDSNNDAQLRGFVVPSGVAEGEAGLFEISYFNSGCNPWSAGAGYYLESVAGHWSPTTVNLDDSHITPVNGTLTRSFVATTTAYDVQNGESVDPSAWRLRNASWMGAATDTKLIPIAHAYAECASFMVPPILTAGQTFPVVMRMKNTGGTTWTNAVGYHLGYTPPNATTWGPAFVELEASDRIEPGETKEFRWWATAPSTPGSYDFFWMMYRDDQYFFDACGPATPITVQ